MLDSVHVVLVFCCPIVPGRSSNRRAISAIERGPDMFCQFCQAGMALAAKVPAWTLGPCEWLLLGLLVLPGWVRAQPYGATDELARASAAAEQGINLLHSGKYD